MKRSNFQFNSRFFWLLKTKLPEIRSKKHMHALARSWNICSCLRELSNQLLVDRNKKNATHGKFCSWKIHSGNVTTAAAATTTTTAAPSPSHQREDVYTATPWRPFWMENWCPLGSSILQLWPPSNCLETSQSHPSHPTAWIRRRLESLNATLEHAKHLSSGRLRGRRAVNTAGSGHRRTTTTESGENISLGSQNISLIFKNVIRP